MANVDEILSKLKENAAKLTKAAEKVTKDAASVVENKTREARIRYAMHEIEERIQTNYAAIGGAVYIAIKDDTEPEDFSEIIGRIDALNDELEELRQRLHNECDLEICPDCKGFVASKDVFCPKCGAKVKNDE